MAGGAYSKEQLALLLEGVSRIFNGFIVGLVLGVIFAIAYVTVVLASFGNVESLIQGFGILFVIIGLLFIPILIITSFMVVSYTYRRQIGVSMVLVCGGVLGY